MYQIILLDYSMPDLDGPQVAKKIRDMISKAGLTQPYICCCTAYVEAVFEKRALDAGMDHFLVKPIGKNEVQKILVLLH